MSSVVPRIIATRPRREPGDAITSTFSGLSKTIRDAGLLRRRYGFYITLMSVLAVALGGTITGMILLGDSWLQLILAGVLGIVFTQIAFLTHEASHRAVLESGKANDRLGRALAAGVVGISYSWWMTKHTRHHANPNKIGKDPDIEVDTISFLEEDAAKAKGVVAWITRRQGYLFFPLLTFEGINLHVRSITDRVTDSSTPGRWIELSLIAARFAVFLTFLFWLLPLGMAFAFLGVQLAVFGVYMGASFAPNHKGMAIVPRESKMDFLRKQVLTSRNITGGVPVTTLMGGLNYQIEHHLFPSMPRPSLARAREIVKEHCELLSVPYTETTLVRSYGIVIGYLNRVGLSARDPFDCPTAMQLKRW